MVLQYLDVTAGAGQTGVGQTGTSESWQMVKDLQGLDRGEMDFPICLLPVEDPIKWEILPAARYEHAGLQVHFVLPSFLPSS